MENTGGTLAVTKGMVRQV